MKYLEEKCKLLSKKYETTKRQLSRVRSEAKSKPLAPRSKVDSLLKKSNIRPESAAEVRKRLQVDCLDGLAKMNWIILMLKTHLEMETKDTF